MPTSKMYIYVQVSNFLSEERRFYMSDILITAGEAAKGLATTTDIPANKCITKAEFDELVNGTPETGLVPDKAPNGIYVMHRNGRLFSKEHWNSSGSDASGVAVKTDKCQFVIAKDEQTNIQWGVYGTLVNGCVTTTNSTQAQQDYAGEVNTTAIINTLGVYQVLAEKLSVDDIVNDAKHEMTAVQSLQSQETTTPISEESSKIKQQFKEKYNIQDISDDVLDLIVTKIRDNFKAQVQESEHISLLSNEIAFIPTTEEIDNISDEGIMVLASSFSEQYAANYCRNYTFPHGKKGYLPALGELYEAYQNKSEVDACMKLIGGKALYDSSIDNYYKWSSTQYSASYAWILNWNNGSISNSLKNTSNDYNCARPFSAFQ